jgi:acetyl-CoA C-acetyltransferase
MSTNANISKNQQAVIIGVGEITEKLESGKIGREPMRLIVTACENAISDSGANSDALKSAISALYVINQMGWPYADIAGLVAQNLGTSGVHCDESPVGGNMPTLYLADAARQVQSGEQEVVVVAGGESTASLVAAGKLQQRPEWTPPQAGKPRPSKADFFHPEALKYGLNMPIDVYPLYDNAIRAEWGQSYAEAQQESGDIGAGMAAVAAENSNSWMGKAFSSEEISSPSEKNRMVVHPYTKWMIANPVVNQASACIVTTYEKAIALGVAEDKLVYIGSGVGGAEPRDILSRSGYTEAHAMSSVLKKTLAVNNMSAVPELVELYSCFPCVPKLARRALGLSETAVLSVTGGLTFFGAAVNNYMGHAIAAMVHAIRAGKGGNGLLYGNGEFVTKHHALVLFSQPVNKPVENLNLQEELDANYGEVPEVLRAYSGPSVLETYSLWYSRDGQPERAALICRTPDNKRHLAAVNDAVTLQALINGEKEVIGASGVASVGEDGFNYWLAV